jgi:DNA-binding MarR family transcriptional regulator
MNMSKQIKSVGKWVSIIDRYGQMYMERKYQKYGIGHGQAKFLLLLYEKDGVSQDTLAYQLRMDKATTARAIQKLECVGFVRRQPSKEDRRMNLVYLTEEAIKIEQEIKAIRSTWTDVITKGFSGEEKEQLLDMLKRVADNAVDYLNELERR